MCSAVRGGEVYERAATLIQALPLPAANPLTDLRARAKDEYAREYKDLVTYARQEFELALRLPTDDRRCRPDAKAGLARVDKMPAEITLP